MDVIIVLYRSADCIGDALASLPAHVGIILVENLPGDGSVDAALGMRPDAIVLRPGRNLGFGGACNLAIGRSSAPFLLMLNPDASLATDCLDQLVGHLGANPSCGAVGPLVLRSDDGTIDSAGMDVLAPGWTRDRSRGLRENDAPKPGIVSCLSAGVLLLRRNALESIGRHPDAFWADLFLYNEDVELSFALRQGGWELHFHPRARAFHAVGGSSPPRRPIRAMAARNRLLTGIVHLGWRDLLRPTSLLRWAWRIAMDTPRLLDNFRLPELRSALPPLAKQLPGRRARIRKRVR
ncbi:MAG: glycosyltransferase family 2 protein [Fibrobacterota bacterium]|nr:glycosyltransferase family 2 protein [Fibrobacterota bacterium]QQS03687.1 MAG: glycosyltransferase family 2 protein [Fibrobacterota bacterium]